MNFLNNTLDFHKSVIEKIKLNMGFFVLVAFIYLFSDFVLFLQPLMIDGFTNQTDGVMYYAKWVLYVATLMSYLTTACLLSLYFKRKNKDESRIKNYLKPLISYKVYLTYAILILTIPLAISLSIRFVPQIEELFNKAMVILSSPENASLNEEAKFDLMFRNPEIVNIFNGIQLWQVIACTVTFFVTLLAGYAAFVFTLPMIVRDKSIGFFKSIKMSFMAVINNFAVFSLTILLILILKAIIPILFVNILPPSVMSFIETYYLNYSGRFFSALIDAVFLFYIVIGLEKFVLTNDKK